MKSIYLSAFLVILSLSVFSQETRYILKDRSSGEYEKVTDTIWQVKKVVSRISESNEIINDTIWVAFKKNKLYSQNRFSLNDESASNNLFGKGKGFVSLVSQSSLASGLGLEGVRIGYFVAENSLIGGSGQIRFSENTGVNLSAFYRAYFGKGEQGKAWAEFNTSLIASEGSSTGGFGLGLGYTAMLNRLAGFDFGLNYQKFGKVKGEVVLNIGFVLLIGK